jgi:hypothetical protein
MIRFFKILITLDDSLLEKYFIILLSLINPESLFGSGKERKAKRGSKAKDKRVRKRNRKK